MKVGYWVLIVAGVLFVLFMGFYVIFNGSFIATSSEKICNYTDTSGCDRFCNNNEDCKTINCVCLNKNVDLPTCLEYENRTMGCSTGIACMTIGECKCINGGCNVEVGGSS